MADPIDIEGGERDMLAAECALGVLEGEERAAAQRLMLTDPAFAEQVRWWAHRLAGMAEEAGSRVPGEQVWEAIERRLVDLEDSGSIGAAAPIVVDAPEPRRGYSGWTLAGAMAGAAIAAAVAALLVIDPNVAPPTQPAPVSSEAPEQRLVAQAQSEDGAIRLTSLVEQPSGRLSLNVAGLEPGNGQAPELWIVPAGGAPVSLGQIPQGGSIRRDLIGAEQQLLVPGSSLAVTYEDPQTIPHPAPTGEILLLGAFSEV